jgi:hypothetical protein
MVMSIYKYFYGYLIFILSAIAASVVMVVLGKTFFELGIFATIVLNIFIGLIAYAIGLAYLFIANTLLKQDFLIPDREFYIWALMYGLTEGLGSSVYAPYMPNMIWLDGLLNGTPFRLFVPALVVTVLYVLFKVYRHPSGGRHLS